MADANNLQQLREQRFFAEWNEIVTSERIETSESSIRGLIDDLIALGPQLTEDSARRAVDMCVRRFNNIDDGWICTIEHEDIYEQVSRVVDACSFDCQEDWLEGRDW